MLNKRAIKLPLFRVGSGYDVHKLIKVDKESDGFIMLCGLKIPYNKKIIAHSDGDVAIHALVDSILGAMGCGDIGDYFPPEDDQWKGCDSSKFLLDVCQKVKFYGYLISNVDITIICQRPRISPYKKQMKNNIAILLNIDPSFVNIKATTTENLGFIGREEGIAAQASVSCLLSE